MEKVMDNSIAPRPEKPRMRNCGPIVGWRLVCEKWVVYGDTAEEAYHGWLAAIHTPEDCRAANQFFRGACD